MFSKCLFLSLSCLQLFAQAPPAFTAAQNSALTAMEAEVAGPSNDLNAERKALLAVTLLEPSNASALMARVTAIRDAELKLATARQQTFRKVQSSPARLEEGQVAVLSASGRLTRGSQPSVPAYSGKGTIPDIREAQVAALTRFSTDLMPLTRTLGAARAALAAASIDLSNDASALRMKAGAIRAAELTVAQARAHAFAQIQSSANRLRPDQVEAFLVMGGTFASVSFTHSEPLNFADHAGYIPLFDGVSLKGWDGNPKFWRVEAGAIIGESTAQNPSGNSYLVYRDVEAKDFTLKFEIKVEGPGGSGLQYRSKTGMPWLANIPANVTANVGPVNSNWMLTGPQADFWPSSKDWTGQFYSENTPMRILAWRGDVVEGSGLARKQLMGSIGDREVLGRVVRMNDWNEYTVIARGGTLIQILNGQLMAVMVDDDPESSNNQSGLFGIEIEATTKISVRNIWLKKLN
jgi:hypothetical protein